ncbi:hypothetical protein Q8A73_020191 [Channa argus]|nr:hypothetical protein Q8A73_020191 [Channa argus]
MAAHSSLHANDTMIKPIGFNSHSSPQQQISAEKATAYRKCIQRKPWRCDFMDGQTLDNEDRSGWYLLRNCKSRLVRLRALLHSPGAAETSVSLLYAVSLPFLCRAKAKMSRLKADLFGCNRLHNWLSSTA